MLQKKKGNHALGLADGSKKKTVGSVKVGGPLLLIKLLVIDHLSIGRMRIGLWQLWPR